MDKLQDNLRIFVAHKNESTRSQLTRVVRGFGHMVEDNCHTVEDLISRCTASRPDLVISGVDLVDGNAIDALVRISEEEPTPAIIVTAKDSLADVEKALQDHVMAYLIEPVEEEEIRPTIYLVCERFRQFELLKEQNENLKQALTDRKVIERAKGLLMERENLPEAEAFRLLQKKAQSARIRMAEIAQQILAEDADA